MLNFVRKSIGMSGMCGMCGVSGADRETKSAVSRRSHWQWTRVCAPPTKCRWNNKMSTKPSQNNDKMSTKPSQNNKDSVLIKCVKNIYKWIDNITHYGIIHHHNAYMARSGEPMTASAMSSSCSSVKARCTASCFSVRVAVRGSLSST